jgi:septal ring factor EnvC (AmiA/AmiB activator)
MIIKQLQQRLDQLKAEYKSGQQVLAELEAKQTNVQNTLLRIGGAIQVLEEELAKAAEESPAEDSPKEFSDEFSEAGTEVPVEVSPDSHG